jgi:trehalose 6-phosphate phosphatase
VYWQDAIPTLLQRLIDSNRPGLISDMDGTLSPIVPRPDDARPTERNLELLAALNDQLPLVALISGRSVLDLRQRVGLSQLTYVGNHGLEQWENGTIRTPPEVAQYRSAVKNAVRELEGRQVDGMQVEDKGVTLSLHYRRTSEPEQIAATFAPIIRDIAQQNGLRFFQGRMVFELRPPVEVNKGSAFRSLVETHALDAAVYLGDDTTDVDALRMARQLRKQGAAYTLGIGVESDDTPSDVQAEADLLVSGVSGVESFLDWLLSACSASRT